MKVEITYSGIDLEVVYDLSEGVRPSEGFDLMGVRLGEVEISDLLSDKVAHEIMEKAIEHLEEA